MGAYIIGMEMPKSCFDCPCYHHKVDDGYYDYEICRASGTVFNDGYASVTGHKTHIDPFRARLDNCPLVPVPPHGLIAREQILDAIRLELAQANACNDMDDYEAWVRVFDYVRKFPTIIPAEEGE